MNGNEGISRAIVTVSGPAMTGSRTTFTSAKGEYEVGNLSPGRYTVTASKSGFLTLQHGQRYTFDFGRSLTLSENEVLDRIDVILPRSAAIEGRIVDEAGQPLADVQVSALRIAFTLGRHQAVPAGRVVFSDDLGQFRIHGLGPGDYYVSAVLRGQLTAGSQVVELGYPPTFFPNSPSLSQAQLVPVKLGETSQTGIIQLQLGNTFQVSGKATAADGTALAGAGVYLVASTGVVVPINSPVRNDGSFLLSGVSAGDYQIRVSRGGTPQAPLETVGVPLRVDTDVQGLELRVPAPTYATGRLVLDPASGAKQIPSAADKALFSIGLVAVTPGTPFDSTTATIGPELEFKIRIPESPVRLRLATAAPGWAVHDVRLQGVSLEHGVLNMPPGSTVDQLEVVVTDRVGHVSGSVSTDDLTRSYSVLLFPQDPELRAYPSLALRGVRTDQQGQFQIPGVAPGNYLAIALNYLDPAESADPAFYEKIASKASALTIKPSEKVELRLTVVQREQ